MTAKISTALICLLLMVSVGCEQKTPTSTTGQSALTPPITQTDVRNPARPGPKNPLHQLKLGTPPYHLINAMVVNSRGKPESLRFEMIAGSLNANPNVVHHKVLPANLGFLPQTISSKRLGGTGFPVQAVILGDPIDPGKVVQIKPVGVIQARKGGLMRDKIIAILAQPPEKALAFKGIDKKMQQELKEYFPNVIRFLGADEATSLIGIGYRSYQKEQSR